MSTQIDVVDLLDDWDSMPDDIREVMDRLSDLDSLDYSKVKEVEQAAEAIGYTFDWGLDGVPFNLRKAVGEGEQ